MLLIYALLLLLLAALPTLMVIRNLPLFRLESGAGEGGVGAISVLIPARNEQAGIGAAVESVLGSDHPEFEVIVLDDHSTDDTAAIVQQLAASDARVRLAMSAELPDGWNGKQHACWQLAQIACHPRLLFMDADVRLQPTALRELVHQQAQRSVSLLSGFPQQEMGTLSEQLLIPMMYVVLLGYLPLERMRASRDPRFGAGCGQLFLADREDYFRCDGHRAIRGSRHDGLQLPRRFRASGMATDLADASHLARVRMYHGWQEVTRGLLKNAREGMASMPLILIFSILLLGAFTLPTLSLAHAIYWGWPPLVTSLVGLAMLVGMVPRAMIALSLRHSPLGVILQPLAVLWFVALQWYAYGRWLFGLQPLTWRGRT